MANDVYTINVKVDVQDKQALKSMIDELQRIAGQAPAAKRGVDNMNKSLRQTQIQARTSGRAVQNASYQIQDMIVQISGGVDPLRSFSQQLPQLFINAGKWGAALGLVAAALPLVIEYVRQAADALAPFDKEMESLEESLSGVASVAKDLDFTSWNKEWNQATMQVQQASLALLQFQERASRKEMNDALLALQGENIELGWVDRLQIGLTAFGEYLVGLKDVYEAIDDISADSSDQLEKVKDEFDLTKEQARELINLLNSGLTGESLLTQVALFTTTVDTLNPKLIELVSNLQRLAQAGADRQALLAQIEAVQAAIASGGTLSEGDEASASAKAASDYAKALSELAAAYKALYPDQVKFFEAVKLANAQMEAGFITAEEYAMRTAAAAEELTGSEETDRIAAMFEETTEAGRDFSNNMIEQVDALGDAMKLFDRSFETMLDGVLMGTQSLADGFRDMAKVIIAQMLKLAAYKGIAAIFAGSASGSIGDSIYQAFSTNAKGNAFSGGNVIPMAKGGIVNGPTVFPMAKGMGLMGEAGPEAVMPLSRDSQGNLGVKGGTNIVINNLAPGVSVQPRETNQGLTIEVVMDQVANAVRQGGNAIANSLEDSYQLGRGGATY